MYVFFFLKEAEALLSIKMKEIYEKYFILD